MEVSGQLHAPVTLSLMDTALVLTGQKNGVSPMSYRQVPYRNFKHNEGTENCQRAKFQYANPRIKS